MKMKTQPTRNYEIQQTWCWRGKSIIWAPTSKNQKSQVNNNVNDITQDRRKVGAHETQN
jgi:hypothetical protein